MRAIILEGPDGTGKSSLAERLSSHFNLPVHKIGPRPKTAQEVVDHLAQQQALVERGDVILDRSTAFSQFVYGKVMAPDGDSGDLQNSRLAVNALMECRPSVVYCYTPRPDRKPECYDAPGRLQLEEQNFSALHDAYIRLLVEAQIDFIHYNFRIANSFDWLITGIHYDNA